LLGHGRGLGLGFIAFPGCPQAVFASYGLFSPEEKVTVIAFPEELSIVWSRLPNFTKCSLLAWLAIT